MHLGHLAYLEAAAARCGELFVGITNPDRMALRPEPADPARHLPASNPYTYTERMLMITAVGAEVGLDDLRVIPFPITEPALWDDYVPREVVHFLRVLSPWGSAKLDRLAGRGYHVEVLAAPEGKQVSGEQVRAMIRDGGDWRRLVPPAVADFIDNLPTDHALAPRPAA